MCFFSLTSAPFASRSQQACRPAPCCPLAASVACLPPPRASSGCREQRRRTSRSAPPRAVSAEREKTKANASKCCTSTKRRTKNTQAHTQHTNKYTNTQTCQHTDSQIHNTQNKHAHAHTCVNHVYRETLKYTHTNLKKGIIELYTEILKTQTSKYVYEVYSKRHTKTHGHIHNTHTRTHAQIRKHVAIQRKTKPTHRHTHITLHDTCVRPADHKLEWLFLKK